LKNITLLWGLNSWEVYKVLNLFDDENDSLFDNFQSSIFENINRILINTESSIISRVDPLLTFTQFSKF
jgi:hypothetical protein